MNGCGKQKQIYHDIEKSALYFRFSSIVCAIVSAMIWLVTLQAHICDCLAVYAAM